MVLRRLAGAVAVPAVALGTLALAPAAAVGTTGESGAVTGTVFRDYSADGARAAREPGEPGVVVTAYDATGATVGTATSGADGTYALTVTGAVSTVVRLGFAVSPTKVAYLVEGPLGPDSGGAVQFATLGDTGVDFGVENPGEYCQANPGLATSCSSFGDQQGPTASSAALRGVVYATANTGGGPTADQVALAAHADVGTTFALEWARGTGTLFSAAFHKQYAGFGPGGPGAVYRTVGGLTSLFATVPNAGTDARAGYDPNSATLPTAGEDWVHDPTYAAVGANALGDMALTDDESTLWVVNLADRKLYPVATADGAVGTPVAVPLATGAAVACAAIDVRPFALSRHDGTFYLGETCSGASTQQATDLRVYVYAFDPVARTFGAVPVFEAPIAATAHGNVGDGCNGGTGAWHAWATTDHFTAGECGYPQPWLVSLAFDRGDLLLGLRDRFADQSAANYPYLAGTLEGVAAGDLLRACGAPDTGWTLETNGSCGGVTTGGAGNAQGPGGGEYYWNERFSDGTDLQETFNGGIAQVPGFPTVAYTASDPDLSTSSTDWSAGGIHYDRHDTGANDHWVELYDKCDSTGAACPPGRNPTGTFGKANGLGDLVALCDAAPVEIGDRVWFDADGDGTQDAGEPPLADVPVTLTAADGETVLATTSTATDGTYVFSSDPNRADAAGRAYRIAALAPGAQVIVSVPTSRTIAPYGAVVLTVPQAAAADVDSDAAPATGRSSPVTITGPGRHDHRIDMGYRIAPAGGVACSVYIDVNRNGVRDAGESVLPGVTVRLLTGDGTLVATAVTDADGNCRFDGIPPGSYRLRQDQPGGYSSTTPDDVLVDVQSGRTATLAGFGEAPPTLPRTGAETGTMTAVAAVLVAAGLMLLRWERRLARARRLQAIFDGARR